MGDEDGVNQVKEKNDGVVALAEAGHASISEGFGCFGIKTIGGRFAGFGLKTRHGRFDGLNLKTTGWTVLRVCP